MTGWMSYFEELDTLRHVARPQQALRDACASQDMAGLGGLLRLPDLHSTSCMVCLSL